MFTGKFFALVVGLILASHVVVSFATNHEVLPGKLFIWFNDKNGREASENYITTSMSSYEAGEYVRKLSENFELTVIFKANSDVDSVVNHPIVGKSLNSAANKEILQYVYPAKPLHDSKEGMNIHETLHHVELFPVEKQQTIHVSNLDSFLSHHEARILNNKEVEFVEVEVDGLEALHDEKLSSIMEKLSSTKNILFVSYDDNQRLNADFQRSQITGSKHSISRNLLEYRRKLSTASSDLIDGKSYKPEGGEYAIYYEDTYLYITPDLFTGLLTGLFFFFVFYLGLSCLGSIQGMSSFYDKLPSVGKEA